MNSERRHLNPQEKIAALKRHLLEGVPVSTICDELGIAPTVFYRWQKELERPRSLREWPQGQGDRRRQRREDPEARSQAHAQKRGHGRAHGGSHPGKKRNGEL